METRGLGGQIRVLMPKFTVTILVPYSGSIKLKKMEKAPQNCDTEDIFEIIVIVFPKTMIY